MDLNLRTIRSFRAIVSSGSFTGAAEHLGISQPTMSQQIRRLEDQLGFPLFTRSTRRVALSRHGEDFLPTADRLLSAHFEAVQDARRLRLRLGRSLRIGTSFATGAIEDRNDLIADFAASRGDIDLQVVNDGQSAIIEALAVGAIDVAIVLGVRVDPTDYARMRHPPGSFPDGPSVFTIGRRRIGLLMPRADTPSIDLASCTARRIAMIAPQMCPPLLGPIVEEIERCGIGLIYPPEAENAVAVEYFGARLGIPALALGWFPLPRQQGTHVLIDSIDAETELAMILPVAPATPSRQAFLDHCKAWREGHHR